jgi:hypothetical protein
MNSYKYFLIYDRNNKIIYGECIYWCCGEFDSVKQSDVTIRLKKKFKARFIVSNTRLEKKRGQITCFIILCHDCSGIGI